MAGPALRAVELASALAGRGMQVTLLAPRGAGALDLPPGLEVVSLVGADLQSLAGSHRRLVMGAGLLARFPALVRARVPMALDFYDPVPLEAAELYRGAGAAVRGAVLAEARETLRLELRRADAVLCASERQEDLWRGALMLAGRDDVPILRVPFGVPEEPPAAFPEKVMRGVVPGIGPDDQVVLWAGGLHDWLDPELVVRAVGEVVATHPGVRLVFMGSAPPNASLQEHGAAVRARDIATHDGLIGRSVFFLDGWVPYAERGRYLQEADIGVSAHPATLEARYSWRTRILDYLWAGVPVVCSGGDPLGEMVAERGAGLTSPPGDVEAFAANLEMLVESAAHRAELSVAAAELAGALHWSAVAAPLAAWVEGPAPEARQVGRQVPLALWWMYGVKATVALRNGGVSGLRQRMGRFRDRRS